MPIISKKVEKQAFWTLSVFPRDLFDPSVDLWIKRIDFPHMAIFFLVIASGSYIHAKWKSRSKILLSITLSFKSYFTGLWTYFVVLTWTFKCFYYLHSERGTWTVTWEMFCNMFTSSFTFYMYVHFLITGIVSPIYWKLQFLKDNIFFPRMIDHIEFLMSNVRRKIFICGHIVLLHSDTLNAANWQTPLTVDADIDGLSTSPESTYTTLTCQGPLSLLEKFVKSSPGEARRSRSCSGRALHLVIIGILKILLLWYYELCVRFKFKYH